MSKLAWNDIDWNIIQRRISRQQRRVYKASIERNKEKVHAIQRRIINSLDFKLLAIQQVIIKNKVSIIISKELISHEKKIELAYQLKINSTIKKTNLNSTKNKFQFLEILNIQDQAKQILIKFALEPEWEALFEPNSYGFRPGRSCHDLIATFLFSLKRKSRYIIYVNLHKCFYSTDYEKLLKKLSTFNSIKSHLKLWLKTGIIKNYQNRHNDIFKEVEFQFRNDILSPLMLNIALHGLGNFIRSWYKSIWYSTKGKNFNIQKYNKKTIFGLSRYADNFIITTSVNININEIKTQVGIWLYNEIGIILSKSKIKIINSNEGFELIGFRIITIKNQLTKKYKVKIYPSRSSKTFIIRSIHNLIQKNKSVPVYSLITILSIRIIVWANYFRFSECKQDFSKIDYLIFNQIRLWILKKKPKGLISRIKVKSKYFPKGNIYNFKGKNYRNNWILTAKTKTKSGNIKENFLPRMVWVSSSKYIKIKAKASPYNNNNLYWTKRFRKYSKFNYEFDIYN